MDSKPFYLSKGIIGGLLICAGAVGKALLSGEVNIDVIQTFGLGLSALGIRFAVN